MRWGRMRNHNQRDRQDRTERGPLSLYGKTTVALQKDHCHHATVCLLKYSSSTKILRHIRFMERSL